MIMRTMLVSALVAAVGLAGCADSDDGEEPIDTFSDDGGGFGGGGTATWDDGDDGNETTTTTEEPRFG